MAINYQALGAGLGSLGNSVSQMGAKPATFSGSAQSQPQPQAGSTEGNVLGTFTNWLKQRRDAQRAAAAATSNPDAHIGPDPSQITPPTVRPYPFGGQ